MNRKLREYAKRYIKERLEQCSDAQLRLFIRMNSDPMKGPQTLDQILDRMSSMKLSDHMELADSFLQRALEERSAKTNEQVNASV